MDPFARGKIANMHADLGAAYAGLAMFDEAVREYLTREEARQSFRDEADKALRDYEENGLHATQAEIDAWVDSLGKRRPRRAPKWHK